MFTKEHLTTECFPCLRIGMYAGPCARFDDYEIVDEEGLHKMIVDKANSFCLDKLSNRLPLVKGMKATSIGDVWDHNYGDSWLNMDVEADFDAIGDIMLNDERVNGEFFAANIPPEWERKTFIGFLREIHSDEGSSWRWKSIALWLYFAMNGIDADQYQDDFIYEYDDCWPNYVKYPGEEE